jgi:hypothetical protein
VNQRFLGTWLLESFETQRTDGAVVRPLGEAPVGTFAFDDSGYFSVQLGPGPAGGAGYTAFFGTWRTDSDGEQGLNTLSLLAGSNPERISGEQPRYFTFVEAGLLRMRPPQGADGSQSTIMWRRALSS